MNAVVFGGSGFLGSHVADALSEAGHAVTIYDLRPSPHLRPDQKMVVGDILDREKVEKTIAQNQLVYHFAGIADIDDCVQNPIETVKCNIEGTVQLLDICKNHLGKIRRFVFASSAYVYSRSGYFYRTSKFACESFIEDYQNLYGLPYSILRFGSLYGERADERNSIHRMLKQALTEGKITYCGTGEELREFIHVKDAARSSVDILAPEFENQHIVLTGTQAIRYRTLLEMISEILGGTVSIEIKPSERKSHYSVTPYNFSPKIGKKLLNNPHIDMGQGLLSCMAEIFGNIHPAPQETPDLQLDERT